jgi:hypothetical protein
MKFLRNKNAPPTAGLVQEFIDTAYDNVKLVADNLPALLEISDAIENGTLDDFLTDNDIDTLAKLNAFVLDAELASEAYVDAAVVGLYDYKGGYDADTNTPDLTTSPNGIKLADTYQVTVGGIFFTTNVEPGDQVTAAQDSPALESDWTILNRNIDSAAFATAAQGAKADTALQPGQVDNISELNNDAGYTDDQSPAEIAAAYTIQVPIASQIEMETGTEVGIRQMSPERVAESIAALSGSMNPIYKLSNYTAVKNDLVYSGSGLSHLLPLAPIINDKVSFRDQSNIAGTSNITIGGNGQTITDEDGADTSYVIDVNGAWVDFIFNGATWLYTYTFVVPLILDPSIIPLIVDAPTLVLNTTHNGLTLQFENQICAITIPDGLPSGFQVMCSWATGQPTATPVTELVNGVLTPVTPAAQWKKMHLEKPNSNSWFATY